VILSALTTHYDGFSAETDNQGGHTDILARYQRPTSGVAGRNSAEAVRS
jgi:hypothetical protein